MRLDCGCRKALSFDNVFIKPKRSALPSRDFDLERTFKFRSGNEWSGVPLIAANMDHTGTFAMAQALSPFGCMTALHKFYTKEELAQEINQPGVGYNSWVSIGMNALDKLVDTLSVVRNPHPKICIDVANGYTQAFSDYVAKVRFVCPQAIIMAGNVATYEQTQQLIISGADIVKVGIGPGSVCTTRRITGVGVPQVSAIDECADAAHGLGGMVCADGGCRYPGDIAKALAVGADFVMLGGMLAGHDECDGEKIYDEDGPVTEYVVENPNCNLDDHPSAREAYSSSSASPWITKIVENDPIGIRFHGMSSREAQEQHHGGLKEYRAAEGKEVTVPYRGPVRETILEILGGLRSTMTYIGAQRLKDIPKCATLVITHEQLNGSFS